MATPPLSQETEAATAPKPHQGSRPELAKPLTAANVDFAEVDRLLQQMPTGNITYNVPPTMVQGEPHQIHLLMSPSQSLEDLKKQLQNRVQGNESLEGAQIKIAERMQASLTGPDFDIAPGEPQVQPVSSVEPTEWQWTVTPKKAGLLELRLDLYALLILKDGPPIPRKIRTFDKTIKVRVTPLQLVSGFVQGNWQWLWAAVLVPFVGWLWTKRKKHKGERKSGLSTKTTKV